MIDQANNQKRQNALAKLNAPLNNYTAAQPEVFTEPPAVTEETVPEVTEPTVPAIAPTTQRNYPEMPAPPTPPTP